MNTKNSLFFSTLLCSSLKYSFKFPSKDIDTVIMDNIKPSEAKTPYIFSTVLILNVF